MFGEERVKTHTIYSNKTIEIQLIIVPLEHLRKATAQAWGLDPDKEVVIKLDILYEDYPRLYAVWIGWVESS